MSMPTSLTLLASGTYSSSMSGIGPTLAPYAPIRGVFQLDVAAAPSTSSATATLDVYLTHSIDSSTYDAFLHFPQVGNGASAVSKTIASWNGLVAASSSQNMHTASPTTLSAGYVINGAVGSLWRVSYVIANGPSASAYSFSVKGNVYQF